MVSRTPRPYYPRERPGTHFTGGWVGSRAGLGEGKTSSPPDSILERPARRQSLYRLSYPAHIWYQCPHKSVLRRRILISVTSHPDTTYLHEQGCEDLSLFFEAKGGPREESLGNTEGGVAGRVPFAGDQILWVTDLFPSLGNFRFISQLQLLLFGI